MQNQLQAKLQRRQQASGLPEQPVQKTPQKKVQPAKGNSQFEANRNKIKAMFEQQAKGGSSTTENVPLPPKEEIKGNADGFKNARLLLEQNLGKPSGGSSSSSGSSNLPSLNLPPPPPPPPSLSNLPPPPPPPPSLNSTSSGLPPPPRLSTVLPPPPSLNTVLPPPPSLNTPTQKTTNLPPPPPPPPSFNQQVNMKKQKSTNLPPPPPPPPSYQTSNISQQQQPQQQYQNYQPPQNSNINNQNNRQKQQPAQIKTQQNFILPPPPPPPPVMNTQYNQPQQQYQQPVQNNYQPPQQERPQQNNYQQSNYQQSNYQPQQQYQQYQQPQYQQKQPQYQQPQQQSHLSPQQQQLPRPQQQQNNRTPTKPSQQKPQRQNIFTNTPKPNISAQFFNNDVAGFIKRQFIRQTDIMSVIGTQLKKSTFNFNYPSIQNQVRHIQGNQTMYADVDNLNLASCYRQRNMNSIKIHNTSRQQFLNTFKNNYNWQTDPQKYKQIQQQARSIPSNIRYKQPNFTKIKQSLVQCDKIINNFIKYQNYNGCAETKKIKEEIQKYAALYMKTPENNQLVLDQIQRRLQAVRDMQK